MNTPGYSRPSSYFRSSSSWPAKRGTKGFLGGTVLLLSLLALGSSAFAQTTKAVENSPVTVSPTSVTFASRLVGTTSAAQTVTVTNHLNTGLAFSSVAASGDFDVAGDSCSSRLVGPGLKCAVGVTFTPKALGLRQGILTINYSALGSPSRVALSGTGDDTGLAITITDLPTGALAHVTVTDPNGQKTILTSSRIINAIPGTYTITAAPVVVGTSTYSATAPTQTAIVASGNTTTATVDYRDVAPATTKVLDSAGETSLSVSSDGLTLTMSASSPVAQSLAPGDVLIVPPTSTGGVAPKGMLRQVASVSGNDSEIVATTQWGTLSEAFQRASFRVQTRLASSTIQAVHPAPGVTFHPGASLPRAVNGRRLLSTSESVSDPCGGYSLGVFDVTEPIQVDAVPGLTLSGSVEVCSGLDFSVDIIGTGFLGLVPTVNSLTATASMGAYSDLTLQGNFLSGSFDQQITLATLDFPPIDIPGLPVWVTPGVSVFVGANGSLTSGISAEVSAAGTFTGGVSYASGNWSPVPLAPSLQFAYQPPTLNASLSAKAYAGIEFDLYVYDIVGPSFKPDAYLDLEANINQNPWWTLAAGLEGPMSLDVTFLGENLASYDLGTMFDYRNVIASASGPFSPPTTLASLAFNPTSIAPGASTTGTVKLSAAAPTGGALVTLSSNNTSVLPVPANVTVPAGSTTATFIATASSSVTTSTQVTVTATYNNSSKSATVTVAPSITVTVSPPTAQVPVNGLQQFTATVTGTSSVAVTWSVNGVSGGNSTVGTISAGGLYTAPATVPNPAAVTVSATSQAVTTVSGSASVTIGPYTETPVYSFTSLSDGAAPSAPLIQASDGYYYGTTQVGGANGDGTVFKVDSSGNVTPLYEFSGTDGANPIAPLIQASDGYFYGTSEWGGAYGEGTVFKIDTSGNLSTLYSFTGGIDGSDVSGGLIQASDGYLYGTTFGGGGSGYGTVFKTDTSGDLTTLYSFSGGADGAGPESSLIQANDGYFYGTALGGGDLSCHIWTGISGCGVVFKMDSAGSLTPLYAFTGGADGANPSEALMPASDGYFYGTTVFGGDSSCSVSTFTGCGTIFKINSAGNLTTMHEFSGGSEGGVPFSSLIQATDGDFYGTATAGGDPSCSVTASGENYPTYIGCGTVFKMDSAGNVNALYSFTGSPNDGSNPFAALLQGSDGYFYGTTRWGGTESSCPYTDNGGCGTVFRLSGPGGALAAQRTTERKRPVTHLSNPSPSTLRRKPVSGVPIVRKSPRPQSPRGIRPPASVQ